MPKLLYFKEYKASPGASIRLDNGEKCFTFITSAGTVVKKQRFPFGVMLYKERNALLAIDTAEALAALFPNYCVPKDSTNFVFRTFLNAVWHCATTTEVRWTINHAKELAKERGL